MKNNYLVIIAIIAVVLIGVWWVMNQPISTGPSYFCDTDEDCVKKQGQCTFECLHKDQEPAVDPLVDCEFRPWFERESCKCINNHCTKITCEDLGLNYIVCNTKVIVE